MGRNGRFGGTQAATFGKPPSVAPSRFCAKRLSGDWESRTVNSRAGAGGLVEQTCLTKTTEQRPRLPLAWCDDWRTRAPWKTPCYCSG
jgi:hypothetical protein